LKTLFTFFLLITISIAAKAQQEENVGGIIFDYDTKFRINKVSITNTRTQKSVYNNNKGEFFVNVKKGDLLISSLMGYKSDTLTYTGQTTIIIYLKRRAIPLPEVIFKDSVLSAKEKYEETKKAFNKAARLGNNKDILNIGQNGVGLGIDAIWSTFSREGKNARKLMETMERDYQNAFIDQVFTKDLVTKTTGLKGDRLLVFMINFRPSYNFVIRANQYDMGSYIKMAYMRFKMGNYQDLSQLKPIENP
jgi:hypothetical protein